MQQLSSRARVLLGAAVSASLLVLSACGGEDVEVSDALVSTTPDEFRIVEEDGGSYAVGHGIVVELAEGWTDYEPEIESIEGTTWEWAVGQPVETTPFPAGLQFSMGQPDQGAQLDAGMSTATEKVAELSEDYELLDKGDVDVPGAEAAEFLRFHRTLDYNGEGYPVEQVTLMIQVADDTSSTIRFIAPEGEWESLMQEAYESVKVTAG